MLFLLVYVKKYSTFAAEKYARPIFFISSFVLVCVLTLFGDEGSGFY